MTVLDDAIEKAKEMGRDHALNAFGWWAQEAIGGRATGDVRPFAERVLAGIEDGDPEILDTLPGPDLSGEWADSYTPEQLRDDCHPMDADCSESCILPDDTSDDLCSAYEAAFTERVDELIVGACKQVLEGDQERIV